MSLKVLFGMFVILLSTTNILVAQTISPWRGSATYPPDSPVKEWYNAEPRPGIVCQVLVLRRPIDPQLHLRGFDENWNGKEVVQLVWISRVGGETKIDQQIRVRHIVAEKELDPIDGYSVFDTHCSKLATELTERIKKMFLGYLGIN